MSSPLQLYPDRAVVLPPRYLGTIDYYAVMAAYGKVYVDYGMRFDKREKAVHRTTIADTRGKLDLTVPISKPVSMTRACWNEISISSHGEWWNVHLTALESAYGRTPFFEFYIDRFKPFFRRPDNLAIANLDAALDREICDILRLDTERLMSAPPGDYDDFRRCLPAFSPVPYWQVRSCSLGFIPGLSVLDLIFNLGPESPLYLKRLLAQI